MGYCRAGFTEIVGVDIKPQPRYPFSFRQMDALEYAAMAWPMFDAIHASPPCQAYSALRHLRPGLEYPDLVAGTRELLFAIGLPYVIENVPNAPLQQVIQLCGSSFGLAVRRHRWFESNRLLFGSDCLHERQGRPIDVSGTGGRRVNRRPDDHGGNTNKPRSLKEAQDAIGIDWCGRYGVSQAIPPAYTEFIGKQLMVELNDERLAGGCQRV